MIGAPVTASGCWNDEPLAYRCIAMLQHAVHQVSALTCDCAVQHTACVGIRPSAHLCKVNAAHSGAAKDDLWQLLTAVPLRSTRSQSSARRAGKTATHERVYIPGK